MPCISCAGLQIIRWTLNTQHGTEGFHLHGTLAWYRGVSLHDDRGVQMETTHIHIKCGFIC